MRRDMCFLLMAERPDRVSCVFFAELPGYGKNNLFFYRFAGFPDGRNKYRKASNFLAFMSIICTILKNDMFSNKKYI